jgi:hypothetical protein
LFYFPGDSLVYHTVLSDKVKRKKIRKNETLIPGLVKWIDGYRCCLRRNAADRSLYPSCGVILFSRVFVFLHKITEFLGGNVGALVLVF